MQRLTDHPIVIDVMNAVYRWEPNETAILEALLKLAEKWDVRYQELLDGEDAVEHIRDN